MSTRKGPALEVRSGPSTPPEVRDGVTGLKRVSGLGVPYNVWSADLGGFRERIAPGAFADSMEKDDWRVVFNHDSSFIVGRKSAGTAHFTDSPAGLRYSAELPDTTWARDMAQSIARGDINQNSFAMVVPDDGQEWRKAPDGLMERTITRGVLREMGPQSFPAYEATSANVRSVAEVRALGEAVLARAPGGHRSVHVRRLSDYRAQLAASERKLASIEGNDLPTRRRHLAAAERALAGCCASDARPLGTLPEPWQLRVMLERCYGPTLRRTAYHEAGHAVAALLEGAGVRWVGIGFRKDGLEWTPHGGRMSPRRTIREPSTWLAGLAANRLAQTEPFKLDDILASVDYKAHERMARERGRAPSLAYDHDLRHADVLLGRNWRAVRALAERLLEVGVVSGDEAEAIVLGALDADTREQVRRLAA